MAEVALGPGKALTFIKHVKRRQWYSVFEKHLWLLPERL